MSHPDFACLVQHKKMSFREQCQRPVHFTSRRSESLAKFGTARDEP